MSLASRRSAVREHAPIHTVAVRNRAPTRADRVSMEFDAPAMGYVEKIDKAFTNATWERLGRNSDSETTSGHPNDGRCASCSAKPGSPSLAGLERRSEHDPEKHTLAWRGYAPPKS